MKIEKVTYTCPNTGQGAGAIVEPEETPEEALSKLRDWVRSQSNLSSELETLNRQKYELTWDLDNLVNCVYRAKKVWEEFQAKWEEAKRFAEVHGLEIKEEFPCPPLLFFDYEQALGQNSASPVSEAGAK